MWTFGIWTIGLLVHQVNTLKEVLKMKQNFEKNEAVTGKISFFEVGSFYSHHSICLNIGFQYRSFVWKWCVFNLSVLN